MGERLGGAIVAEKGLQRTPPLHYMGYYVAGLANAVAKGVEGELARFDLDSLAFAIIRRCYEGEEDTVTAISQSLPVDTARISRMVTELTTKKLIRRRRLRSDRRIVKLYLTPEGQELAPQLIECVRSQVAMLLEDVSDEEYANFVSTCEKVMVNFERWTTTQQ